MVVRASERTGPDRFEILVTWDSRRYMFITNLTSPFPPSCHLFLPLRSKFASNGTAGLKTLKRKLFLKNLDFQLWRKSLFFNLLAEVKYSKSVHAKIYYLWEGALWYNIVQEGGQLNFVVIQTKSSAHNKQDVNKRKQKQAKTAINLKSHYELQFKISVRTEYVHNCFLGLLTCRCLSYEFNTAWNRKFTHL